MLRNVCCVVLMTLIMGLIEPVSADPVRRDIAKITNSEPTSLQAEDATGCIMIRTASDLDRMRLDLGGFYCLANDIDMGSIANFVPIGLTYNSGNAVILPFSGRFVGRGHVIRNLTIESPGSAVGLFANLLGEVTDLSLVDADVRGVWPSSKYYAYTPSVGGLAGRFSGRIMRSHVSGRVSGVSNEYLFAMEVGGLVGKSDGSVCFDPYDPRMVAAITHSSSSAAVTGGDGDQYFESRVGGLAGSLFRCPVADSYATGPVTGGSGARVGGLIGAAGWDLEAGEFKRIPIISRSHASGPVRAVNTQYNPGGGVGGLVGALFGENKGHSTIESSYATGSVSLTGSVNYLVFAGGLVGKAEASLISRSFATGAVHAGGPAEPTAGCIGGLVGSLYHSAIAQSYAAGPVATDIEQLNAGGLVGCIPSNGQSTIAQSYSVGRVNAYKPNAIGGLVGQNDFPGLVTKSYWDMLTGYGTSAGGGKPRTTPQLQAALPSGFATAVWALTPGVSYPYLKVAGLEFASPLATTVANDRVYVFPPLDQHDPFQYQNPPAHADEASLAAVYTMIARAVGVAVDDGRLKDIAIDRYFWDDTTQQALWKGPIKLYAQIGKLVRIEAHEEIGDANITGPLKDRKIAIVRGRFTLPSGDTGTHWMLATLFTVDKNGTLTELVADDSWTGQQVRIDPAAKTVVSPVGFPLENFTVNGFRVVTLMGAAPPP